MRIGRASVRYRNYLNYLTSLGTFEALEPRVLLSGGVCMPPLPLLGWTEVSEAPEVIVVASPADNNATPDDAVVSPEDGSDGEESDPAIVANPGAIEDPIIIDDGETDPSDRTDDWWNDQPTDDWIEWPDEEEYYDPMADAANLPSLDTEQIGSIDLPGQWVYFRFDGKAGTTYSIVAKSLGDQSLSVDFTNESGSFGGDTAAAGTSWEITTWGPFGADETWIVGVSAHELGQFAISAQVLDFTPPADDPGDDVDWGGDIIVDPIDWKDPDIIDAKEPVDGWIPGDGEVIYFYAAGSANGENEAVRRSVVDGGPASATAADDAAQVAALADPDAPKPQAERPMAQPAFNSAVHGDGSGILSSMLSKSDDDLLAGDVSGSLL